MQGTRKNGNLYPKRKVFLRTRCEEIIEFDYNYQKWNLITKYRQTESETHMCDITKIK